MAARLDGRGVLVTGAAGGMGRACARLFGATHDLILTDATPRLDDFACELADEGYAIALSHAGDLGDAAVLDALVAAVRGDRPLTLVHTAGLSPAQADWRAIMAVNLVATVRLLDALEPVLQPGSVAVLIASSAGHAMPPMPEIDAITADPLAPGFLDAIGAVVERLARGEAAAMPGVAYMLSKQAVLGLVERRAVAWGRRGARIVSISPGLILTPMGRRELAETKGAAELLAATPVGRGGTAMDIALAARFLASDAAGFVSGCDLKVDGGGTAATRTAGAAGERASVPGGRSDRMAQ